MEKVRFERTIIAHDLFKISRWNEGRKKAVRCEEVTTCWRVEYRKRNSRHLASIKRNTVESVRDSVNKTGTPLRENVRKILTT